MVVRVEMPVEILVEMSVVRLTETEILVRMLVSMSVAVTVLVTVSGVPPSGGLVLSLC